MIAVSLVISASSNHAQGYDDTFTRGVNEGTVGDIDAPPTGWISEGIIGD
jgi:hypothetical protein